ncbi:MAG: hypothetical protein WA419_21080 [Silvibacterium sp.]
MRRLSGAKPVTTGPFTSKVRHPAAQSQEHPASVQPVEPEDPVQTGSSKPAQREVLKHNVQTDQAQEHPETVAGQHATGSFTDRKRRAG